MTTARRPAAPRTARRAVGTMYVGLALTVLATLAPFLDHATTQVLADHIRSGYPDYSEARVDEAVRLYQVCLAVVGVLGTACWLWTIRAVRSGKRWARFGATAFFLCALSVALSAVTVKDTNGQVGLAPLLGWLTALPCVAGLAAVVLLWRRPS